MNLIELAENLSTNTLPKNIVSEQFNALRQSAINYSSLCAKYKLNLNESIQNDGI